MKLAWHDLGFPAQYRVEIRRATRYTVTVIPVTGTVFVTLWLGAVCCPIPPILAAFAGAVFLSFGLLGGIIGRAGDRRKRRVLRFAAAWEHDERARMVRA